MKYRTVIDFFRGTRALRRAKSLISAETRKGIRGEMKRRDKLKTLRRAVADADYNLGALEEYVLQHVSPMNAPLILISQVHRSGGTLLSQLFDGATALATHPNELKISERAGNEWPALDPQAGAAENFRRMFEGNVVGALRRGYAKGEGDRERHAFYMLPRLQYRLFETLWERFPPADSRTILDHYFTAYFNSWLNFQGQLDQTRWIVAFAPRFADRETNVAAYFADYPDGRLIQVVRNPRSWYPSAKHHGSGGGADRGPDEILHPWCDSVKAILRNRERFGDKVIVLRFEDLVGRTEATMRGLCLKLGIEFDAALLRPTFNGRQITANSSFENSNSGVIVAPLSREKLLSDGELARIEQLCDPLYEKLAAQVLNHAA